MKLNIVLSVITVVCARNLSNVAFNELPEEKLRDALCRSFHKHNSAFSCHTDVCKLDTAFDLKDLQKVTTNSPLNPPQLTCKEDDIAHFLIDNQDDYAYFLSAESDKVIVFSPATTCSHLSVGNLMEGAYRIRLWGVSFSHKRLVYSNVTDITLPSMDTRPSPVTDISVENITCGSNSCDAIINWSPNKDRSCQYDLIWIHDGSIMEDQINVISGIHEASMNDLEFETNYNVEIMARAGDMNESEKKSLSFRTPTCLEVHKNLEICAPESPRNLLINETMIDESGKYNIYIKWEKPDLQPLFYNAQFRNLFGNNTTGKFLNISGNSTHAVFEKVSLGDMYHVSLEACSQAGCSNKVVNERHKMDPVTIEVSSHHQWRVFAFILALLIAVLVVAVLVNYYRIKLKRKADRDKYFKKLDEEKAAGIEKIEMGFIKAEISDEWELDQSKLCFQSVLGEGAFGIVRRAHLELKDNRRIAVAVKMLKECPTAEEIRQFTQEINIMKSVKQHPYIVSLVGCITDRVDGPLLVVEYCSRGDLQSYLRNAWEKFCCVQQDLDDIFTNHKNYFSNRTYLNLDDEEFIIQPKHLLSIARQVSLGMEHLSRTRVVHRDLAARNVLVCENHTVKVSDFGLSRDVYRDNVYCKSGAGKLPIRWMALESLTHQVYTTYSDVWSFGILLWEIVTLGSTPYVGVHSSDLLEYLKNGNRLERPSNCSPELYAIMQSCWKSSPKNRPTFTELCKNLEELLEDITQYLQLDVVDVTGIQHQLCSTERYMRPVNAFK